MPAPAWPAQKLVELQRLASLNYTASQIGELIGATRSAVLGKLLRLGIRLKAKHDSRWTQPLALSAWVLTEQGHSPEIIAERIGHGITAKDVRIKIWNMKAQRQKRSERARAKRAAGHMVDLAPKPRKPIPVLRLPVAAQPVRVRLWDLGAGQCHWPLGGDYDPPEWFCGAPAEIGLDGHVMSYCSPHCAIAYRPAGRIHA